jgi:NADP-dependent 3-hydroxy acid dehydrogenase YdfG
MAEFFNKPEIQKYMSGKEIPILKGSDLAQTVRFMLMTSYDVNITELIVRPAGGS